MLAKLQLAWPEWHLEVHSEHLRVETHHTKSIFGLTKTIDARITPHGHALTGISLVSDYAN